MGHLGSQGVTVTTPSVWASTQWRGRRPGSCTPPPPTSLPTWVRGGRGQVGTGAEKYEDNDDNDANVEANDEANYEDNDDTNLCDGEL